MDLHGQLNVNWDSSEPIAYPKEEGIGHISISERSKYGKLWKELVYLLD